jgi:uncharacterized membrane protein
MIFDTVRRRFKISPVICLILFSFVLSTTAFYWLWTQVSILNENDLGLELPASRLQTLFFLSTPLLALAPFLLTITVVGSYILTKAWMKDVIINIITETSKKHRSTNKLSFLSEEEKTLLKILINNKPEMLQSDLVVKSNLTKYKVTRILNKLEQMELVRREKFGITNIVQLLIEVDSPLT